MMLYKIRKLVLEYMLEIATKELWNDRIKQINKNKLKSFTKKGKVSIIKKYYKKMYNKDINLNDCNTFNEKLQLRKLTNNQLIINCADKVNVREYVKNKIGDKYLIKKYFNKKRITRKDIEDLPNSFAIKTNNASSTNIMVFDKAKEDIDSIVDIMNFFVKIKYGYLWGEYFYNKIKPQIIAEELLVDKKGNIPDDFKIHCFNNGQKKHKFFETFYLVDGKLNKNIYDESWNLIDYNYGFHGDGRKIKKPNNFDEIIDICDKLSEDFNYVRIDLYLFNDKIYFGEMTFTPGAGYAKFDSDDKDYLWGSYM